MFILPVMVKFTPISVLFTVIAVSCSTNYAGGGEDLGTRDPLRQPFSSRSIWNMPIGDSAIYVPAVIERTMAMGMTVDEDIIVLTPEAPMTGIFTNYADWDRTADRCRIEGDQLFSAPIPSGFIVSSDTWDGLTPNSGLAVLMPDRRTIRQTQPFARCTANKPGTSHYVAANQDLYGEGYYGSHGGSGLSAIGGCLRVGELIPGAGPIRHALKVDLYAAKNLYYDTLTKGYRWPAVQRRRLCSRRIREKENGTGRGRLPDGGTAGSAAPHKPRFAWI